ncbi:MAG: alpha/beta hydrolase [Burkholderiales bacterium]|nr:alpha/beta hydrolase [Burkholderiales bacterium]MDE2628586.1 alpha/beta hydrolase [Burkholderiales bacterium]
MLARLQKLITFLLLTAALIWAGHFFRAGQPLLGTIGALLIVLGYAGLLAIEFVLLYFVHGRESSFRPQGRQLLRAWWDEVICTPQVFAWRQPFRSNVETDNLQCGPQRQPGVVLVHGLLCNRGFWNPWMRALRARQVPFIAVNLEPVFGSIDHYPSIIDAAVARLEAATGLPVVLVGHSMGGLAIRAWLARFAGDSRMHRAITIGSPHQGTWLANYSAATNATQMRLHSPWLARLAEQETAARRARFTCFFGHCDNIVMPIDTATLPDAQNVHVPATAHVQMAFRPMVFDEVCHWLRADR